LIIWRLLLSTTAPVALLARTRFSWSEAVLMNTTQSSHVLVGCKEKRLNSFVAASWCSIRLLCVVGGAQAANGTLSLMKSSISRIEAARSGPSASQPGCSSATDVSRVGRRCGRACSTAHSARTSKGP
jgi:hypothetical protein